MVIAKAARISAHGARHSRSIHLGYKFSHFLVESESTLVTIPANSLGIAPRSAGRVITIVVVFALSVLVRPVVNEAGRSIGSALFIKVHVRFVSRLAPEFCIFSINHGKHRHVCRVEVARIFAVKARLAPLVAR